MNRLIETLQRDLELLAQECNDAAAHPQNLDPLLNIAFTWQILTSTTEKFQGSLLIDRNSGGSIESDYVIQDEIQITGSKHGDLLVRFLREMLEEKTEQIEHLDEQKWQQVREEIRAFCLQSLPGPFIEDLP